MSLNISNIINKGRPKIEQKDKAKYNDKLKCDICNVFISRSNKPRHKKSKMHAENNKIIDIIKNSFSQNLKTDKSVLKDRLKTCFVNSSGQTIFLNNKQYEFISNVNY